MSEWLRKIRERAEKALEKKAKYGPDIDLSKYSRIEINEIDDIIGLASEPAKRIGLSDREVSNAGYVQVNEKIWHGIIVEGLKRQGVIITSTGEALKKYSWVRDYYWRNISVDLDKYTAATELYSNGRGYFIYVPPGVKVKVPVYTCLFITSSWEAQFVHNIVIVGDGAELNLITGCVVPHKIVGALHVGVSEFYVGRNAKLSFAMIHAWNKGVHVRPRTSVRVMDGGSYISYYLVHSDVASIQAYPSVKLDRDAKTHMASIILGSSNSIYDMGSEAVLQGENSSAEIVSRVIGRDESWIAARSRIRAFTSPSRGHIECLGLPLSKKATIIALPELESRVEGAELTHEAAIGKIAEEEIEYLMSKGFTEEEARALILRGFMRVEVPGLPLQTQRLIDATIKLLTEKATG